MAYYRLEPFGSPADDDRFRVLTTNVISPHLKADAEMPIFFDRDPQPRPNQDEADAEDEIAAFFAVRVKPTVS